MPQDPCDPINRALDAIGKPELQLGSITDGTLAGRTARRIYGQTLRQLLRSAHWSFARRSAQMELLASRTGQPPPGAPTPAPFQQISTAVEWPWLYAYAWPTDAVQARWVPWAPVTSGGAPQGNIAIGSAPLMTGLTQTGAAPWLNSRPARFLASTSEQFPVPVTADIDDIEGVGFRSRRIILTDVPNARLVYTALMLEIEMWDELFSQAMVAVLAERLAMPLIADPKERVAIRNGQIAIAKDAIATARAASANEAGFPQTTDQNAPWTLARRARSGYGGGWDGAGGGGGGSSGYLYGSWSSYSFGDSGVY